MAKPKPALKAHMFREQEGRCAYCGVAMTLEYSPDDRTYATFDHIIALDIGGSNEPINKVIACVHCNRGKRSHTVSSLRNMADVLERLINERGLA